MTNCHRGLMSSTECGGAEQMENKRFLRNAVGEVMVDLAEKNEKIVAVSADVMGSCRMTEFVKKYPTRAFNVGIAEQEMVSFAAGLAKEGFIAYAFTFGPFMSMRACEQIRDDVAYNRLNVRFVSTYSGVSGGVSGVTHWTMEDCAIMRGIPEMTILEPCDCTQLHHMLAATINFKGPVYFRISIEPVTEIYNDDYRFELGKAKCVTDGDDGAFICSGVTVKYAIEAAKKINENFGKHIRVIDMQSVKPIDEEAVKEAGRTGNVVVAQDHTMIGGLGDAVATVLTKNKILANFAIKGIPDEFVVMGHAPWLYHKFGYDTDGLYEAMKKLLFGEA